MSTRVIGAVVTQRESCGEIVTQFANFASYSTIQYSLLRTPHKGFSVTIYNSRGNQIEIAQIAIYNCFLQIKSNQIKCWFLERGENRSTRGKTSHSRVENQQTQSTFDAECGNRTRATLVEASALTTTPTLQPTRVRSKPRTNF